MLPARAVASTVAASPAASSLTIVAAPVARYQNGEISENRSWLVSIAARPPALSQ